jgi:hypothetical protein
VKPILSIYSIYDETLAASIRLLEQTRFGSRYTVDNSMNVDFWGVKCCESENSHATEVKCLNTRKKCKINVKTAVNKNFKASIYRFPSETISLSKFYFTI